MNKRMELEQAVARTTALFKTSNNIEIRLTSYRPGKVRLYQIEFLDKETGNIVHTIPSRGWLPRQRLLDLLEGIKETRFAMEMSMFAPPKSSMLYGERIELPLTEHQLRVAWIKYNKEGDKQAAINYICKLGHTRAFAEVEFSMITDGMYDAALGSVK